VVVLSPCDSCSGFRVVKTLQRVSKAGGASKVGTHLPARDVDYLIRLDLVEKIRDRWKLTQLGAWWDEAEN
jgi:hypothetical protein